jgi:energy-converting hydrogenase Eha subunit H
MRFIAGTAFFGGAAIMVSKSGLNEIRKLSGFKYKSNFFIFAQN